MPVLSQYVQQTQFLLHDPNAQAYPLASVQNAINIARSQVAGEGQCIRILLSGGVVVGLTLNSGGAGYGNGPGTVTFTGSGNQAFASAQIVGGAVTQVTLANGGWGWLTAPTVTVTDSTGYNGGAVVTATVDNSASTVAGQEFVSYATLNTLAGYSPGVSQVVGIGSVAVQWGAGSVYKPILRWRPWTWFQANCRVYSISAINFPAYWSDFGQGINGSFYMFPIPGQVLSMDIDAVCLPAPLTSDATPDAIPYPWSDAVPYFAAYQCYMNSSRAPDAARMFNEDSRALGQYQLFMRRARKFSDGIARVPDQYDDWAT